MGSQPMWRVNRRQVLLEGVHDGIPIALGYLVVSFALGIAAKDAGLTAWQGFIASFFNNASAGEYAGFTVIKANAPYLEIALITLIANARYMLMSCVLSQKCSADLPLYHRVFVGFDVTDEIFGISVARSGFLNPYYNYGAMLVALPAWSLGTALGIMVGSTLPTAIVSALSVALYGMFLWVIIPKARQDKVVAGVIAISFILSFLASVLPLTANISEGMRTILLTLIISASAAYFFPVST